MSKDFGERLSSARTKRRLTMQQVADRLGIARSTYAGYESGYREPDIETIIKLARILDIDVNWLLTGEEPQVSLDPERAQFLRWVEENLEGVFFYEFDEAPEESKQAVMESLKFLWEQEKRRMKKGE